MALSVLGPRERGPLGPGTGISLGLPQGASPKEGEYQALCTTTSCHQEDKQREPSAGLYLPKPWRASVSFQKCRQLPGTKPCFKI